jgi:hypothetical protein
MFDKHALPINIFPAPVLVSLFVFSKNIDMNVCHSMQLGAQKVLPDFFQFRMREKEKQRLDEVGGILIHSSCSKIKVRVSKKLLLSLTSNQEGYADHGVSKNSNLMKWKL